MFLSFVLWLFFGVTFAESSLFLKPQELNIESENEKLVEKWSQSAKVLGSLVWPQKKPLLLSYESILQQSKDSFTPICYKSLMATINGLKRDRLWAYKMMDASSKFAPGFLSKRYVDYGDHRQCLGIEAQEDSVKFSGKYCFYRIHLPLPSYDKTSPNNLNLTGSQLDGTWFESLAVNYKLMYFETITNAICFPSTCSSTEIESLMQKHVVGHPLKVTFWSECDTKESINMSFWDHSLYIRLSVTFVCFWSLSVILINLLDHFMPQLSPQFYRHFSFSITRSKLFRPQSEEDARVSFINLLKLIFIVVSIPFHSMCVSMMVADPAAHLNGLERYKGPRDSLYKSILANTDLMITGFIGLSGFLTCYLVHKQLQKTGGKIKFIHYVIPRIAKTLPFVVACSVLFNAILLLPMSGPLASNFIKLRQHTCSDTFLYDFTFTANFLGMQEQCHAMLWFISMDVQLYLTSFLVVPLLYNRPRQGFTVALLIIIGSIVGNAVYFYGSDVSVISDITDSDIKTFLDEIHIWFYTNAHVGSYYIGIVLGWLIANNLRPKNETVIAVGWYLHCLYPVVYLGYCMIRLRDPQTSRLEMSIFGAIRKPLLSLAGCFVSYTVFIGKGGFYTAFGNLKPLVVLARFFGSVNITHMITIGYFLANAKKPMEYEVIPLLSLFVTLGAATIASALVVHFIVEAPAGNLVNVLINSLKTSGNNKSDSQKIKSTNRGVHEKAK